MHNQDCENVEADLSIQESLMRLNEIGIELSSEQNLDKLLDDILTEARTTTNAEAGSLYLCENDCLKFAVFQNDVLSSYQNEGKTGYNPSGISIPLTTSSMAGYVGVTGKAVNIEDVYNIPSDRPYSFNPASDRKNNYRSRSMLVVPMHDPSGKVIGVLQLINALDTIGAVIAFKHSVERLCLSLASMAAVAVRNAMLTDELKNAYMDTIFRLSVAAEYRDEDTSDHLYRMCNYTAIIAGQLGLSDEDVQELRYASPMHDIGKIGVPDAILLKPTELTHAEFEELKKHTVIGARILSQSESKILRLSEEIALNHHEKYNGKGYPHGIGGDEIPLSAQIVAVADVFDAITSKRCYKTALPIEKALHILQSERGEHFHPACVDAFFAGWEEVESIQKHFADKTGKSNVVTDRIKKRPQTGSKKDFPSGFAHTMTHNRTSAKYIFFHD